MAATVWYVPGWMRTDAPQAGVMESLTNTFAEAKVAFKAWDGDKAVWPMAVESADKEVWRLAFEIAMMPQAERERLTLVGHSLGGRIVMRTLARLGERGMKVRQGVVLAAAIPFSDSDIALCGAGSQLPILAVCNPDDVTLRYVYSVMGGESAAAYGANGSLAPVANVRECVTPPDLTQQVAIDRSWAKSQSIKDLANHHALFYLAYMRRLFEGEAPSAAVMVPQQYVNVEWPVTDTGTWWNVLDERKGWKLERNVVTGHCRILNPDTVRAAWGDEKAMRAAFDKVKAQVAAPLRK